MTIDTTAVRAAREDDLKTSAANTVLAVEDLYESALPDSVKTSVLNQLRELIEKANLTGFVDPGTLVSRPILELGAGPATPVAPSSNAEADAALTWLNGFATDIGRTPAQVMTDLPAMYAPLMQLITSGKAPEANARMIACDTVLKGGYTVKPDGTIDMGTSAADLATAKTDAQVARDALAEERDDSKPTSLAGKLKTANTAVTAAVTAAEQALVAKVKPALQIVKDAPELRVGDGRKVKIDDAVLKTATDAVGL